MAKKSPIGSISESYENSFGKEIKRTISEDIAGFGSEFFSQLVGVPVGKRKESAPEQRSTTKPNQGEIFNITNLSKSADKKPTTATERLAAKPERRAAAIEYYDYHREIINASKNESRKEMSEMNNRVQQIQVELKKLIATSKELQMEFGSFVVQQNPTNPGQYYINFFEWMLVIIRSAREKAENSRAWLSTVKGKHGKKVDYWDMYQKNGTSFGLSGERVVATQTG